MNLYQIKGWWAEGSNHTTTKYVIAKSKEQAIAKFTTLTDDVAVIKAVLLCKRDNIVPTLDPKIEFKELTKH